MEQETLDYINKVLAETGESLPTKYQNAINDFIVELKSAGAWAGMDGVYLFKNYSQEAALINIKDPDSYQGVINGGVTFTQDVGLTGNGVDGYVDLNYRPDDGVSNNYSFTSASFGVRLLNPFAVGHRHGNSRIAFERSGTRIEIRTHASSGGNTGPASDQVGDTLIHVDRVDAATGQLFTSGVSRGTISEANDTNQSSTTISIFAGDYGGGYSGYSDNTATFVFTGASQAANASSIYNAITDYENAIDNYVDVPTGVIKLNNQPVEGAVVTYLQADPLNVSNVDVSGTWVKQITDATILGESITNAQGVYEYTGEAFDNTKLLGIKVDYMWWDTDKWRKYSKTEWSDLSLDLSDPTV